ncbi:hypothetical protein [Glaciecola sp. KUL10]|uniref:hypothetical protein n=1 Tax=Glaciecola sp. (strain KUL10) TaxID=2161813 RepID=UPI000D78C417|nr:hypothetical protein [Glaciecola sp. KUL10]GBL03146.1 hypothetical protein KUL10_04270 [Glaciecola sp. KUL10]
MDVKFVAVAIGVISGALRYWITNFWMQPIIRYLAITNEVHVDFIFYAQVVNAQGLNPMDAATNLIGYSNTFDYEKSSDLQKQVRRQLGLPPES